MTSTTPIWPTQLPALSRQQYQWSPNNSFLRTEMESGPAKQRRLFRHQPHIKNVVWQMRTEELEIFEAFYLHQLHSGSLWFTLPLWNGSGYFPHKVRFRKPYQAKLINSNFTEINAELEIDTPKVLNASELKQKLGNAQ